MMKRANMGKQMMAAPKRGPMSQGMDAPDTEFSMPNLKARTMRPGGMAKGGKVHDDAAMDRKLIREEIDKAHKKMGMKKGGSVKGYAKGGMVDGCATRGKTKGRMI